jgi:hypothetical protein
MYSVSYSFYCACCGEVTINEEQFSVEAQATLRFLEIMDAALQEQDLEMVFVSLLGKSGERLATFNKALHTDYLWVEDAAFQSELDLLIYRKEAS